MVNSERRVTKLINYFHVHTYIFVAAILIVYNMVYL